ncbi:hypothetical protein POM88_047306 [Heracleum sosnowskyi]|uniref:RRM domain-containing protein n=1 Tax=Heracleum sosnowskyi TaxID=360622 RepID=A0AAD8GRW9_9APIA|nr:hypothetical protein POM88_047306 [Heracleum sosnowskyi]
MQVEPSIKKELVEELQKVINSQASIAVNGKVKIVVPNLGVKYTRTEALPTVAVYALFKAAIEVELFLSHKRHTNAPASKIVRDVDMKHDYAFVDFSDPRDAEDARYSLNGRDINGSRLIVELAKGLAQLRRDVAATIRSYFKILAKLDTRPVSNKIWRSIGISNKFDS